VLLAVAAKRTLPRPFVYAGFAAWICAMGAFVWSAG